MKREFIGFIGFLAGATLLGGAVACGDDAARSSTSGAPASHDSAAPTTSERISSSSNVAAPPQSPSSASKSAGAAGASTGGANSGTFGSDKPVDEGTAAQIGALDRKIVFNASLALGASDVTAAYSEASSIASRMGGFIEKSQFSGAKDADHDTRSAAVTMRVPVEKYQDALIAIRGIQGIKINNENAHSTEVTEQYTDLQSRQRTLQATEQQYLKLLEQAKTVNDILTVNDRLTNVRTQIEQIQGRLNVLDHQADLATIDLSLAPIVIAKPDAKPHDGPKAIGESFVDAWEASLDAMRYVASAGAVLAVILIWLTLPVGLALLGVRSATRRVRTAAPRTPQPPTPVA